MARLRTLKPGFFSDDQLAEVHPLGRILFAGLWCVADREGRLEDRPKRIKAEVLPYDSCNVDRLLQELHDRGFIVRYEIDGHRFIQVTNFAKHQNPHVKELPSTIPAPCQNSADTVQEQFSPGSPTIGLAIGLQSYELSCEGERESETRTVPPQFTDDEQRTIDAVTATLRPYKFDLDPGLWRLVLDKHPGVDLRVEAHKQADWLKRSRIKTCSASRYTNWLAKADGDIARAANDDDEPDTISGCPVCHTVNWDVSLGPMCPRCERKANGAA